MVPRHHSVVIDIGHHVMLVNIGRTRLDIVPQPMEPIPDGMMDVMDVNNRYDSAQDMDVDAEIEVISDDEGNQEALERLHTTMPNVPHVYNGTGDSPS